MTTIRDVARRAGVAPITASRALSDGGYVSAATRARVRAAAAELNYVPNMLANSLRSNRTDTLALLLSDISNPFWTTVARGVEDVASRLGYTVIYCNTDADEHKQDQYVTMLLRRRVDGVLLVPASASSAAVKALQAQDVKVVVLDHLLKDVAVDVVRGASCEGARLIVRHLLDLGHRRIALLNGPGGVFTAAERARGYCQAHAEAGLPVDDRLLLYGAYTVASGVALAEQVLALHGRPTAIFAANNFLAAGALRTLREHNLRVPADISLVSFDDLPSEYFYEPFLTVVQQPAYELGATAAGLLLGRLRPHAGATPAPPQEIVLPTELVIRTSTAPPKSQQNLDK
jgi:LacI family transcriptional regulator